MADSLTLRVITPDRVLLDTTCSSVVFPTVDGSVGVLKDHAPMVAAIGVGELSFHGDSGKEEGMFIAGGFAEVRENTLRIVTDTSEPPSEIDIERADKAAERARARLAQYESNQGEKPDVLRARLALMRAIQRLRVAQKYRG